ncbi:MAG TPA: hypothetical protein VH062_32915 [Polyangiaceae bacterium]|nr:hypothetical protein [Polyangiaceae bacterium]
MRAASVEVLHCPACGADVPLGEGDETRCVHCGVVVPLPEAHRELRRIQREDAAARQSAERLFSRLDSPPFLVTRILAAVFDQPMLVFWLFFGTPVGLFSIFAGLAVDARFHPPSAVVSFVSFGTLFVLAFLPRSLGIYANRRASGRGILVAGLRARPPKLPGGPEECRECGAPLDVLPGASVARCAYCRADNAVVVSTPFRKQAERTARRVAHTVEQAAEVDRRERAATRSALFREAGRYLLSIGTFGTLFGVYMWDDERVQRRDDGSAPAIGLVALVVGTLLLIVLMLRSGGTKDGRTAEEARLRREGNDLPSWVRVAGPPGVIAILWILRAILW